MAVDEMLLESVGCSGAPTLRFYQWIEPTISLGYFQSLADREQHEASRGCRLVRRASGGGAIIHDRELTYSFCSPIGDRWGQDVGKYYRAFHDSLIAALAERSVEAELCGSGRQVPDEPFLCFQRRSEGDVLIRQAGTGESSGTDAKVAGSAQRRHHGAILQHGSVLLARSQRAPELPGIKELSGVEVTVQELVEMWVRLLSQRLKLHFEPGGYTEHEVKRAGEIEATKFADSRWTSRR